MSKLAINGGAKIRIDLFPNQNTFDHKEVNALLRVAENGRPSSYQANKGPNFLGGPEIQALETEWALEFDAIDNSAIACNSATSGLFIACAAIGLKSEDEVIVSPYSMTCSASVPVWFGAKPVFSDIEKDCFCIDPNFIEKQNLINEKTKAIIAVDIFGQACDYAGLKKLIENAEKKFGNKIYLISDTAQAPGAIYRHSQNSVHRYTGTIGDIGVFSLNFGKHMTSGEGGMIVCEDYQLNMKCRLVMNHAEAVINDYSDNCPSYKNLAMVGLNLRMTELQAAVAREQLLKLDQNIETRRQNVKELTSGLAELTPQITPAKTRRYCTHTYYVDAYLWNSKYGNNIHRNKYIEAVKAELTPRQGRENEGVQIGCGYIKPLFMMPWAKPYYPNYELPNVVNLWKDELFLTLYHAPNSTKKDMQEVAEAFRKVWRYREELK